MGFQTVQLLSEIATGIGALMAGGAALWGVNSWKDKLIDERKHTAARDLLAATYRARNSVVNYRNPDIHSIELPKGYPHARLDVSVLNPETGKALEYILTKKLKYIQDAMTATAFPQLTAQVLWGDEISRLMGALAEACANTIVASDFVIENCFRSTDVSKLTESSRKQLEHAQSAAFGNSSDKSNKMSVKIEAAVSEIEGFLRTKL